ncbi:MAG: DnaD domain protein [Lachnospiraceae bacterium]|nr:DnaD domain protein [Lachnospiraceae bacterium]
MNDIKLCGSRYSGNTIVSNCFIDKYMADANEAQLKIYLYLMRCIEADEPVSVSSLADRFNYTEKDVLRSLCYWANKGIVTMELDERKDISVIILNDPQEAPAVSSKPVKPEEPVQLAAVPSYSVDRISSFRNRAEIRQLIFAAEQYFRRTLSEADMQTIIYLYDDLNFSVDLIEYLIEYCVSSGKGNMNYIQAVALNWSDEGIHSPNDAREYLRLHDSDSYRILKEFGITNRGLTRAEADFIDKWKNDYRFSPEIIREAIARTIRQTARPSFPYADAILTDWHSKGVKQPVDISALDAKHQSQGNIYPKSTARPAANRLKNHAERDYDMKLLEKELTNAALAKAGKL